MHCQSGLYLFHIIVQIYCPINYQVFRKKSVYTASVLEPTLLTLFMLPFSNITHRYMPLQATRGIVSQIADGGSNWWAGNSSAVTLWSCRWLYEHIHTPKRMNNALFPVAVSWYCAFEPGPLHKQINCHCASSGHQLYLHFMTFTFLSCHFKVLLSNSSPGLTPTPTLEVTHNMQHLTNSKINKALLFIKKQSSN